MSKELLTTKQAAELLNLSEKTLSMWRCKGSGPPFIKRGKILYCKPDLDAWLQEAKYTSTAQAKLGRAAE